MILEKEYLITKISDQKDKEYKFSRNLTIDKDGFPVYEELDEIAKLENSEKNIAFFIGDENITMYSLKSNFWFVRKVIEEYNRGYKEELYDRFYSIPKTDKTRKMLEDSIKKIKQFYLEQPLKRSNDAPQRKRV